MKKTLAVLAVGAMLPLCANDGIRFGAQVSTTAPTATFNKEVKQGYGLGGFVVRDLTGRQAVAVKFDVNHFGKRSFVTPAVLWKEAVKGQEAVEGKEAVKAQEAVEGKEAVLAQEAVEGKEAVKAQEAVLAVPKTTTTNRNLIYSLGVDYMLHVNKDQTGVYGLVGVDMENKRVSKTVVTEETETAKETRKCTHDTIRKVGYSVGVGYDFTKELGVQVRYSLHSFKDESHHAKSHPAVSVGVNYAF